MDINLNTVQITVNITLFWTRILFYSFYLNFSQALILLGDFKPTNHLSFTENVKILHNRNVYEQVLVQERLLRDSIFTRSSKQRSRKA